MVGAESFLLVFNLLIFNQNAFLGWLFSIFLNFLQRSVCFKRCSPGFWGEGRLVSKAFRVYDLCKMSALNGRKGFLEYISLFVFSKLQNLSVVAVGVVLLL